MRRRRCVRACAGLVLPWPEFRGYPGPLTVSGPGSSRPERRRSLAGRLQPSVSEGGLPPVAHRRCCAARSRSQGGGLQPSDDESGVSAGQRTSSAVSAGSAETRSAVPRHKPARRHSPADCRTFRLSSGAVCYDAPTRLSSGSACSGGGRMRHHRLIGLVLVGATPLLIPATAQGTREPTIPFDDAGSRSSSTPPTGMPVSRFSPTPRSGSSSRSSGRTAAGS